MSRQNLRILRNGLYLVIILKNDIENKENFMEYPYIIVDPTNQLYPSNIFEFSDC